jgi:hypothetical protein
MLDWMISMMHEKSTNLKHFNFCVCHRITDAGVKLIQGLPSQLGVWEELGRLDRPL